MTNEEYFQKLWNDSIESRNGCGTPALLAVLVLVVLLFCSCATKTRVEYKDREVVKYEKQYVHDTTRIETHDSVYHTVFQKGDTVYDTKYIEKTRWRDHVVVRGDTCWRDSVVTEYKETVKEVVKYPKSYWYLLGFSILFFIFAIYKLTIWLR